MPSRPILTVYPHSLGHKATGVTDAGLAHLQHLTGLRELYLQETQVTDAGLAHLQRLTGLRVLYLHNTRVTDAGRVWPQTALPDVSLRG